MIAYELGVRLNAPDDNSYLLHKLMWDAIAPQRHIELQSSLLFRTVTFDGELRAVARIDSEARQQFAADLPFQPVPCPVIENAQRLHFTVRLCPLYRAGGSRERTPPDPKAWAAGLLLRHGLHAEAIAGGPLERGYFAKDGQRAIRHHTRVYVVTAQVVSVADAQHAWLYGVGRRKSTGCGMLLEE